jgi:hypothetical protein
MSPLNTLNEGLWKEKWAAFAFGNVDDQDLWRSDVPFLGKKVQNTRVFCFKIFRFSETFSVF